MWLPAMSRTDKDSKEHLEWLYSVGYPYRRDVAPSWWNRAQRRQARTKAKQAMREGREPERYRRPYYW